MDPKKLRKHYMQLVPHLNKALKHVQTQFSDLPPSELVLETNVKPYASVKRKIESDSIRDAGELSDLVRGRLFFSEQFNLDDVMDIVQKLFDKDIKDVDKKAIRSKEHGLEYQGVTHVNININGVNFELQIMPLEFKPHKEFLHQIYEKFRNPKELDKMNDKQKDFLRNTHNKMYKSLAQQAKSARMPHSED